MMVLVMVKLRTALGWALTSFLAGAALGPRAVDVVLAMLKKYGLG